MNPTSAPAPSPSVAPPALPASPIPTDPPSGSAVTIALEPSPPAAPADVVRAVGGRIAPLWPLDRFVAVNPYFGLADRSFEEAADLLSTVAGARATLPPAFYLAAAVARAAAQRAERVVRRAARQVAVVVRAVLAEQAAAR